MKKITRKWLGSMAALCLAAGSLAGCGGSSDTGTAAAPAQTNAATEALETTAAGADAEEKEASSGKEGGYKIGWSTIYLTPSWMQETSGLMDACIEKYKADGVIGSYSIANADGDTSVQISQIENMIAEGYDAIILDAGSSDALNQVVEKAVSQGVIVVNFDSLVTTDKVTCRIGTSDVEYGKLCAQWLIDTLGGKGNIIVFSGPAGVAVSDGREKGAMEVLEQNPDINIITTLHSEYNSAPAMEVLNPVLDANEVDGICALGGSLASASLTAVLDKGLDMIPICGENYNGFLRQWSDLVDDGFESFAVCQPNWLGVLAVEQSIRILNGEDYDQDVVVPIPAIDNNNLSEFVPNDYSDDWYPIADITEDQIQKYLTPGA